MGTEAAKEKPVRCTIKIHSYTLEFIECLKEETGNPADASGAFYSRKSVNCKNWYQ